MKPTAAAAAAEVPTAQAFAAMIGAKITPRLATAQVRALVKAPPGYVNVLDDAADQYEIDEGTLRVKDVSADALRALKAAQKLLAKREAVAQEVYRSLYEQRLQLDSQAMKMLQAIGRRIAAMKPDHPELGVDWKSVTDFLAEYHPGRPAAPPPAPTAPIA